MPSWGEVIITEFTKFTHFNKNQDTAFSSKIFLFYEKIFANFSDDALLAVPGQEGGPAADGVTLADNDFGFTPPARIVAGFVCGQRNVATSLQAGSSVT